MTEVKLPQSFVDFSDALKKLYQSSEDATEIVTKWDEITNKWCCSRGGQPRQDSPGPR